MTDEAVATLFRARKRTACRHNWIIDPEGTAVCFNCGKLQDVEATRRGRNNRKRGNRIELEIARSLGLRKVGMFGGPEDVGTRDDPFLIQVKSKSGRAYPEWVERELAKLPVTSVQTPLLVIAEAGVSGKRRRALVVLRMEDWVALHGPAGEVA